MPQKVKVIKAVPMRKRKGVTKAVKTYVKQVVRKAPEHKYTDLNLTGQTTDFSGKILCLSAATAQGQTDLTRVGDKLRLTSVQLKGQIWVPPSSAGYSEPVYLRMILFTWKPEGINAGVASVSNPVPTDLLINGIGSSYAPWSMFTHDKRGQFVVHKDKTFQFNLGLSGVSVSHKFQVTKTFKSHPVKYISASTTNMQNGMYILWISNISAGDTNDYGPNFNYNARLNYTDA